MAKNPGRPVCALPAVSPTPCGAAFGVQPYGTGRGRRTEPAEPPGNRPSNRARPGNGCREPRQSAWPGYLVKRFFKQVAEGPGRPARRNRCRCPGCREQPEFVRVPIKAQIDIRPMRLRTANFITCAALRVEVVSVLPASSIPAAG